MILLGVGAMTVAAGVAGTLLLGGPPLHEGSPIPAVSPTPGTMSPDEQYLRQACGDDTALSEGKHLCVGRNRSLSPSEIAAIIDKIPNMHE